MTKTENRLAAKAYREEKERQRREEARAEAVKADLAELAKLRHYLIFQAKVSIPTDALIQAIDDHVEKLTGDRRTLHMQNHPIG